MFNGELEWHVKSENIAYLLEKAMENKFKLFNNLDVLSHEDRYLDAKVVECINLWIWKLCMTILMGEFLIQRYFIACQIYIIVNSTSNVNDMVTCNTLHQ